MNGRRLTSHRGHGDVRRRCRAILLAVAGCALILSACGSDDDVSLYAGEVPHHFGISDLGRERLVHGIFVCLEGEAQQAITVVDVEPVDVQGMRLGDWFVIDVPADGLLGEEFNDDVERVRAEQGRPDGDTTVSSRCEDNESAQQQIAVVMSPERPGETALVSGFEITWSPLDDPEERRTSYYPVALEFCPSAPGTTDVNDFACVGVLPPSEVEG